MAFRAPRSDDVDVNLTPLIDVVFLLLIFFMVSTSFVKESQIKLTLPEASEEVKELPADTVEIAIDAAGTWFVNGKAVPDKGLDTLKTAIAAAIPEGVDPVVVIAADEGATHQEVIDIMDAARQLGLVRITFPIEVREP